MSDEHITESGTGTVQQDQPASPALVKDPNVLEEAELDWVFCPGEQRMIAGCPPPSTCSPRFTMTKEWVRLTGHLKARQIYKPVTSAADSVAPAAPPPPRPADKAVLKQWVFQLVLERLWGPLREAEKELQQDHPDRHCKLCCDHFDFAQPPDMPLPDDPKKTSPVLDAPTILNKAFEVLLQRNCGCGP
ncbi:MAG TPA: hypothetical protein VNO52_06495 [Methylomirabilota bacterium]|nr:hypothetical protein [Methylomirabilota bacterium]